MSDTDLPFQDMSCTSGSTGRQDRFDGLDLVRRAEILPANGTNDYGFGAPVFARCKTLLFHGKTSREMD